MAQEICVTGRSFWEVEFQTIGWYDRSEVDKAAEIITYYEKIGWETAINVGEMMFRTRNPGESIATYVAAFREFLAKDS
jgi:hypothetical protein